MSFYVGLFIFIISVVVSLIVLIAGKALKKEKFVLLVSVHLVFLFAALASFALQKKTDESGNFFFLLFICSGLILCGLSWKNIELKNFRIYFSLFALSIPLFIVSPSTLMNFLLTASFNSSNEPVIHVEGRYYLEKQNISRSKVAGSYYKLILKKGFFHQTIKRDLTFNGKLDSVKVISFEEGKLLSIRGYTSEVTHVSSEVDSMDQSVPLQAIKPGGNRI